MRIKVKQNLREERVKVKRALRVRTRARAWSRKALKIQGFPGFFMPGKVDVS